MKTLIIAMLVTAAPSIALACSPPLSWQEEGLWLAGLEWSGEGAVPTGDLLVVRSQGSDAPTPTDLVDLVAVEITVEGEAVPGALHPSPLPGQILWVPETPLAAGPTYQFSATVETDWGSEQINTTAFTVEPAPREPPIGATTFSAEKFERTLYGECLASEEGFCGEDEHCIEREEIGVEARFRLEVQVEADLGPWRRARAMRVALGTTRTEALAILARTPFGIMNPERQIGGAAYATWPHGEACGAVEVLDVDGTRLLREADCVALPEDPALSREINARLRAEGQDPSPRADPEPTAPTAPTSRGGGCATVDAPTSGLWALVLLLGLRRRPRLRVRRNRQSTRSSRALAWAQRMISRVSGRSRPSASPAASRAAASA